MSETGHFGVASCDLGDGFRFSNEHGGSGEEGHILFEFKGGTASEPVIGASTHEGAFENMRLAFNRLAGRLTSGVSL